MDYSLSLGTLYRHTENIVDKAALKVRSSGTKSESGIEWEFGGPSGAFAIMAVTHIMLYYFWVCLDSNNGSMVIPTDDEGLWTFTCRIAAYVYNNAKPTKIGRAHV